jgi:hypothetical protein
MSEKSSLDRRVWAYHATHKSALASICAKGLLPMYHRSAREKVIFVEDSPSEVAPYWTNDTVLLRFKIDAFATTRDGEYVVYDRVAPEDLRVLHERRFVPLLSVCSLGA